MRLSLNQFMSNLKRKIRNTSDLYNSFSHICTIICNMLIIYNFLYRRNNFFCTTLSTLANRGLKMLWKCFANTCFFQMFFKYIRTGEQTRYMQTLCKRNQQMICKTFCNCFEKIDYFKYFANEVKNEPFLTLFQALMRYTDALRLRNEDALRLRNEPTLHVKRYFYTGLNTYQHTWFLSIANKFANVVLYFIWLVILTLIWTDIIMCGVVSSPAFDHSMASTDIFSPATTILNAARYTDVLSQTYK